ncbi:magnesium/cobalt transporter CorA [Methylobacillus gramineus]|uniref:magnesium/cobalt transporter CorA n=1 Tax=Methylobacillus gramineus TaxID=755169 RepID=UPI001CFFEEA6|nr:magnesium/cobalt transporter CorA [Methylobacillus gramineus]MCB5183590.1 magnesium/cobalt transporter CorA [Methylobacillus gramineus]
MKKRRHSHSKKIGLPPGTLMHTGDIKTSHIQLTLFSYTADFIEEKTISSLDEIHNTQLPDNTILWLNIHGLHDPALIAAIGQKFKLHPLVLEDILNTDQRPKTDAYEDYLYLVTRFFSYDSEQMAINSEQISLILGDKFVLSFQERPTGSFDPVRERLRANKGLLRKSGADVLAYALLDMIVDQYFAMLEQMSDDCEKLEEQLLRKPSDAVLQSIHRLKRETMDLRRAVWPLREIINSLIRNEFGFFQESTILYLRDVYDHSIHFIESLESLRDLLAGMLDIYLSSISNQVNKEVRILTVVTMLFMPATLISGIFGMNFEHMPLLNDDWGFWFAIGLMLLVAGGMALHFWRRQWLSRH